MLRLIHAQTVVGPLLIDDIDDGMPNKQVHRLGSTADPKAYKRDGYANAAKQPCYIPRVNPDDTTLPGFIDLEETERVTHSAFNGKIKGFQTSGHLSVVSLSASDLVAPAITSAEFDSGDTGDLTITGTNFLSITPAVTKVVITGSITGSPKTLTSADFDSISETEIVILAADLAGMADGDTVVVTADGQASASEAIVDTAP
jgi:hypothetical protein